jgi:hypothetical protein
LQAAVEGSLVFVMQALLTQRLQPMLASPISIIGSSSLNNDSNSIKLTLHAGNV